MTTKNNKKKNRKSYSLEDKYQVVLHHQKYKTTIQQTLSVKFNMPIGTINAILKKQDEIKEKFLSGSTKEKLKQKIHQQSKTDRISKILFHWFSQQREKNKIITNDLLTLHAKK